MRIIILLFICWTPLTLFSQDITDTQHISGDFNRQIGLDITDLLSNLIGFSSNSSFASPTYFLNYKWRKNEKVNRTGLGFLFEIDSEGMGIDSDFLINFRVGREKQINFSNRWRFSYGGDFKTNVSFRNLGTVDVSQLQIGIGGAPIVGIEYFINPRLSLATEAAYNVFLVVKDQMGETSFGAVSSMQFPQSVIVHFAF